MKPVFKNLNKKKLIILSAALWMSILFMTYLFLKPNKEDNLLKEVTNPKKTPISKNNNPDDFYLFKPTPIFNNKYDEILNKSFKTKKSKDNEIKNIISKQKIFNQNEDIIFEIFKSITTES